jgi:hypothetical protein
MLQNIRSLIGLLVLSLGIFTVVAMIPMWAWYGLGMLGLGLFLVYCALGFMDNGFKINSRLTNDVSTAQSDCDTSKR